MCLQEKAAVAKVDESGLIRAQLKGSTSFMRRLAALCACGMRSVPILDNNDEDVTAPAKPMNTYAATPMYVHRCPAQQGNAGNPGATSSTDHSIAGNVPTCRGHCRVQVQEY